jgi:hypothetical protein
VTETPETAAKPSLREVVARVTARTVSAAGLRPCYRYPPRLPAESFGGLGQELRFSDALFRSAPLARQFLALPYEPVGRLAVSSAHWEPFEGTDATRRRAWAAFGAPGGAFEAVSSARFQELELRTPPRTPSPPGTERWLLEEQFPTGGGSDEYCPIHQETEQGSLLDLVQLIGATAAEFAKRIAESGSPAEAKIVDDAVAAAVVHWRQDPYEYTLSVAARVHGGYVSGLKFWAAFWSEDERSGVRHLSKPVELIAPGVVVARLEEFAPYSAQSGLLMTVLWEQFEALRCLLARKSAADCSSELARHVLLP